MNAALQDYSSLSISERIQLVEDIWDSIAEEAPAEIGLSEAQVAEVNRRVENHRLHPESGVPWSEVRRKLFERHE